MTTECKREKRAYFLPRTLRLALGPLRPAAGGGAGLVQLVYWEVALQAMSASWRARD